ncbi:MULTISPECIES: NAD(P)H-flavin reductase [Aliivibrio]|uniref:NAD(P)H-flavin reductase n=1 Tax=Aliivibrio finisterrensis TaxID=511998 RepID=A0A6N6RVM4_9GAMM|nr:MULTISPECIES: NAD(P)H-flavin reductase [Aliivibrio]KAB2825776.1 NAD(P)H-flavin reductase [Aliivibrio finisterrensis]MDD9174242.1 NAD(P)H-flavin reductase [Aliivibrio sp. S3TY1]MDD9191319.1 NAD(P)H-flavin reductase [Aliivibrio sp. S2TY2]
MLVNCKVSKIESVNKNIYKVKVTPDHPIVFKAGQYIFIKIEDNKKQPFSIANCPTDIGSIELHIGSSDESSAFNIIEFFLNVFEKKINFEIDAPHGDAWLREDSSNPLLLIAGGTGLSYINSILKNCLNRKLMQPIYLYWGVKNRDYLYADEELKALSQKYNNLHYVPVVLEDCENMWLGKRGTVLNAVMEDFTDLTLFDIYVCGPFMMAKAAKEQLISEKKARSEQMFADAFAYL